MQGAPAELFAELWQRALVRYHPVMLCVLALERNPAEALPKDEDVTFSLAELLCDEADAFFAAMAEHTPAATRRRPRVVCALCGSLLCPTYHQQCLAEGEVTVVMIGQDEAADGG